MARTRRPPAGARPVGGLAVGLAAGFLVLTIATPLPDPGALGFLVDVELTGTCYSLAGSSPGYEADPTIAYFGLAAVPLGVAGWAAVAASGRPDLRRIRRLALVAGGLVVGAILVTGSWTNGGCGGLL